MTLVPPMIGETVLGSFRLERRLGSGTYAVAYLAQQLGMDRRAVVKLPHPHLLEGPHGAEIRRRFATEARAASRASHPHIVTIYMVGETEGNMPALAMEFAEGSPLARTLGLDGPLPLVQLAALGEQLGGALQALHKVDIVHRDLSPENVIVTLQNGRMFAKLLDFGVAKLLDGPSRTLGPMGTPGYLAPEQLQGQVTPRTDVYSLGAVLWWALTGHERPDEYTTGELQRSLNVSSGPDPRAVRPDTPAQLAEVISHMLVPDHRLRLDIDEFIPRWRAALDATAIPQVYVSSGSATPHSNSERVGSRIAICVGNTVLRTLTASYLRATSSWELELCEASTLLRADPDRYLAVVLDTAISGLDTRELLQRMSVSHSLVPLIVVGNAEDARVHWTAFGAQSFVRVPDSLELLRDELARSIGGASKRDEQHRHVPSSTRARLHADGSLLGHLEDFIGFIPQVLAELHMALDEGQAGRVVGLCGPLITRCDKLGLRRLSALTRAVEAFASGSDLDNAGAFLTSVEQTYEQAFPELLELIQLENSQKKIRS